MLDGFTRDEVWIGFLRRLDYAIVRQDIGLALPDGDIMLEMHRRLVIHGPYRPAIPLRIDLFFSRLIMGSIASTRPSFSLAPVPRRP